MRHRNILGQGEQSRVGTCHRISRPKNRHGYLAGKPLASHFPATCQNRLINLQRPGRSLVFVAGLKRKVIVIVRMFDPGGKLGCRGRPNQLDILASNQSPSPVSQIRCNGVKLASFYGRLAPDESLNFVETGGGLPAASHNCVVDCLCLECRGLAACRGKREGTTLTLELDLNRPSLHSETPAIAREAVFENPALPKLC